jgi:RTX calcium-binding nonapeptide repeat (4 copies)
MNPATTRARLARLLGATVAVAAVAGFGAGRADAAFSTQLGAQTLRVTGDGAGDRLALRLQAGSPGTLQVDVGDDGTADFSFDRSKFTKILVDAGGGDDAVRIDEANGPFTNTEATTLNGGGGNDSLAGGSASEAISGGDGDDSILGARGDDRSLSGGAGDDTFTWNPGEGSDTQDGGPGNDVLAFRGANGAETFDASANAGQFRLFRNVGNITMLSRGIEKVDLDALGGADAITVGNLGSSGVALFDADLGPGDAAQDVVHVLGTGGPDNVQIVPDGTAVRVTGLGSETRIASPEAANDRLSVETQAGQDAVAGSNGLAPLIKLTLDGGPGQDTLGGGDGADTILGSDGADLVDGNRGDDSAFLGAGNDTFRWDPGDGSDVVEGQEGVDTQLFNGANVNERFEVSANGPRVRFTRDIANIVMDLDGVERLDTRTFGGVDLATVNDLSGTDVIRADVDLESAPGSAEGDTAKDEIRVVGTPAADNVRVSGGAFGVRVQGLVPEVRIDHSEPPYDTLTLDLGNGVDSVDASSLHPYTIMLTVDAGPGDESLIGSDGRDTFVWNPGDGSDRIEGGDDTDTLVFNGSNGDERMELSANGNRLRFFRNLGNIVMDVGGVEDVETAALGGKDTLIVNDLAGTGVTRTAFDLAGTLGGTSGDGAEDGLFVHGTDAAETIELLGQNGLVSMEGLPALFVVTNAEPANDQLILTTEGGDDDVSASALAASSVRLTLDTGAGKDTVKGSGGADSILAGPDADDVTPGRGDDVAFLGSEDDRVVWNPGDGSDVVEGQEGVDTQLFNGANVAETFDVAANGTRVRFFRNIANITMDLDGVESLDTNTLGGVDTATVHDLSGTDVTSVDFDLASTIGGAAGDGAADTVVVEGTNGSDVAVVAGSRR